ncbi:MAG: hypothetical protein EHM43_06685 [Ignavibacteriae bacterium]|nr:MAG: hypothetical protein EHM43_06685 [Ignavibacteriota bacterium]
MATQPKLEQRLRDLSHEELIDVILAVADTNTSARKVIVSMTSTIKEQVSAVKKDLKKLTQRPTSHRRVMPRDVANALSSIVAQIDRISHHAPSMAFPLLCAVIVAEEDVHSYVHDSYGTISDVYYGDVIPLMVLMTQRTSDPTVLLDGLRSVCSRDAFGTVARLMQTIADVLPEQVVTTLLDEVQDNHVRKAIYRGIGDILNYIHTVELSGELRANDHFEIADMYLDHDDLKGAQQYLDKVSLLDRESSLRGREVYERYVMHTKYPAQIEGFMHARILSSPSPEQVDAYRAQFGDEALSTVIDELVQKTAQTSASDIHSASPFLCLVREGRSADAAAIIETGTISPFGYYRPWGELVQALASHGHHRAASLIVRLFLEFAIAPAKSAYYDEAIRLYRLLDELAEFVTDWGTHEEHDAYMALFVERHERKWSFWERFAAIRG